MRALWPNARHRQSVRPAAMEMDHAGARSGGIAASSKYRDTFGREAARSHRRDARRKAGPEQGSDSGVYAPGRDLPGGPDDAGVHAPVLSGYRPRRVERLALAGRARAPHAVGPGAHLRPEPGRAPRGRAPRGLAAGRHHALLRLADGSRRSRPMASRRTHVPIGDEYLQSPGEADDPLGEDATTPPVPGLVHRYPDRVLFLVTGFCSTYCRYCTRSRMVGEAGGEYHFSTAQWEQAIDYIEAHPEIRDVLHVRRRSADPGRRQARLAPRPAARDPARRVRPHRHQDAGRAAAAHHPQL